MSRYIARFMKDVLGANGHEAEICQRSLEIEAGNIPLAADLAKLRFCEAENVKDWSLHADRVHELTPNFRRKIAARAICEAIRCKRRCRPPHSDSAGNLAS
jgi:hypothetical protein